MKYFAFPPVEDAAFGEVYPPQEGGQEQTFPADYALLALLKINNPKPE